jgi:hypothetical protein
VGYVGYAPRPGTLALAAAVVLLAIAPACTVIEPEVGERVVACADADSNPNAKVDFKTQIRPIMSGMVPGPKPCANCHYHSAGTMDGINASGLDLETLATLKKGGRNTQSDIVIAGKPCESAIVSKLRGTYDGARMPKGGPYWTPDQIQLMKDWIFEGAEGMGTD